MNERKAVLSVKPISVSQLNSYVKRLIATDPILGDIIVTGEVSNLVKHNSGHHYFTLKDEKSRLNCFLSFDQAMKMRFILSEGMQIILYGNISVYEKGGTYSLNIRDIDMAGEGALNIAFENLKKKLLAEGIFNPAHKQELPVFPNKIAVITSPTGAAVRDIISTIKGRNPVVDILVYPCLVQGAEAAQSIATAIATLNTNFNDVDLIIMGRGGGSLEDLWAFNEEIVARAVFNSKIPIISAVGHETDTVISDYVADMRAATPTAAAQLAVIDIETIKNKLFALDPSKVYIDLHKKIEVNMEKCMYLMQSAESILSFRFQEAKNRLNICALAFELSNPVNMIKRGYAIVSKNNGEWIISSSAMSIHDKIKILMKDGTVHCTVERIEEDVWLKEKKQ
ncbi:MAG: exodeoxyribonuclease VII large subunit [Clostridia bacterium]|nr:exodeoxyribonuclease VII large subunit [Clostridia bacterium]